MAEQENNREKINTLLEKIKTQYQFQNDTELEQFLEGAADAETQGVTYWDYVEVDTLLSLQKPKTNYPDEVIFIAYHQICELYFKLIIQELQKITQPEKFKPHFLEKDEEIRWQKGLDRVARYMNKLIGSFDIMKFGLDGRQFATFRKALLPASGFQTHQFRLIEIMLTPYYNLIREDARALLPEKLELEKHFEYIYWRSGAIEKSTGKPAKILRNFNDKYDKLFGKQLKEFAEKSVYARYEKATPEFKAAVGKSMLAVEESILMWKVSHIRSVMRHIPVDKSGTGGTKWEEYLPLKNQKVYYFPAFWKGKNISTEVERMCAEYPQKMIRELSDMLAVDK